MSLEKKRQQELKRPDTFQKKGLVLIDWIRDHRPQFLMALAPVLLIIGGVFIWTTIAGQNTEKRRAQLGQIDQQFVDEAEAALKQQEEIQKKITAIDLKLKTDPKDNANAGASAITEAERASLSAEKESLELQFKDIKPNHTASQQKFVDFYKEHQKQPEGWRAALQAVTINVEKGSYKEAAALLEELLPFAVSSPFYNLQARTMYISLLEELGDYDKALTEVEALLANPSDDTIARLLLVKGRIQLLSGKKEDAEATFDKIIAEHNTTAEAKKAKSYKAL